MKPSVTVLTTVYNGLPYLKEAIESTLSQSFSTFEYMIIDDKSPDKSVVKFINTYNDPRISLIKNEKNLGVSDTYNKALSLIKSDYVVRIDQDDVNLPDRIREQIEYLELHPKISIVCSWEQTIDSNGKKIRDWKRTLNNYGDFLGYILIGLCPIWHPSIAFRTKDMIDAGGFKKEYTRAEDFEVTTRLALKRYGAAVVPKFHLLQRQHEASQSKEFSDKQAEVARKIHDEALVFFSSHADIKKLAAFLRLETDASDTKFDQAYLKRLSLALDDLFYHVKEKQKMSDEELKSLKTIIYKRAGYGIRYSSVLCSMPAFLFYPIFYILSPLHLRKFRSLLSSLYHNILGLRYIFK
jgi:glycosyltransferase involved in cell wall biosynthesis